VGLLRFDLEGQVLDGLAYDLELGCVVSCRIRSAKERVAAGARGRRDLNRVADVFEVNAIVFHREAASARIR
jgi:hypothetical protein